jgi:hypothetical protein
MSKMSMPRVATLDLRPTERLLPLLAGLGIFGLTLAWSVAGAAPFSDASQAPSPQVVACPQPSVIGCLLTFEAPVSSTILDSETPHLWLLSVPNAGTLTVTLTYPSLLSTITVYAPDGNFIGSATNEEESSAAVMATVSDAGTYTITVLNAGGDISGEPYSLAASLQSAPATPRPQLQTTPVTVNPYDPAGVPPTPVNPYRPL